MENETKPVELIIESDEVVKRYAITEAIEIVRCKTCIYFHATGFFAVSKPTLANNLKGGALFEMLQWYCDYMDNRDSYPEDQQEKFDTVAAMMINILSIPMDAFTDIDFMIDIADYILQKRNEYYERLTREAAEPREETLEDAVKNANFEGEVLLEQEIVKDLDKMAKENDAKRNAS